MSELASVLRALKNSRNLQHWDKPPREFGPDNPEDSDYNRNGLKDVGDLSKVTFSPGFSFGDNDDGNEESKPDDAWPEISTDIERLEEPAVEAQKQRGDESLDVARKAREQYRLSLLLEKLALEKECQHLVTERSRACHEAYLNQLNKIRSESDNTWNKYLFSEDEKLAREENRLRERKQEAQQAVNECQNEYSLHISQCSSQLVMALERAQQQEAEEASIRRLHLNNLKQLYNNFISHLTQMRGLHKELVGSEALDSETESLLNQTVTQVEGVMSSGQQSAVTEDQFVTAQASLQQGFISLKEITHSLNLKKEEKVKLEMEKAAQEAEAQLTAQHEVTSAQEPQSQEIESLEETCLVPSSDGINRLRELKEKVKLFLKVKDELSPPRVLKLRQLAKPANQLNVNDQFINRDRLQQLLSIFAGREVEPGKGTLNNASELLYMKNLVVRNVVKLGISHDKPMTAVCSWLLVNLVVAHPDMWELFMYHLFSECLGLVPVLPERSAYQSVDLLHRTLGRKDEEGLDAFSRRNGNGAYMYGMVLAMLTKKKDSPEQAPVRGWQLMAKILSTSPVPYVTGEILLHFLKGVGVVLQQTYGKQFLKLMVYLGNVYLPQIDEIKEAGGHQCYVMLESFIKEFETTGKMQQDSLLEKFK